MGYLNSSVPHDTLARVMHIASVDVPAVRCSSRMPSDMTAGKSHSVRLDEHTEARVARILDTLTAADPYRDVSDADVLRMLIRRGAEDFEREHKLPALEAAPAPAAKKGAKRKARKP